MFVVFDRLKGNSGVYKPEINMFMFWSVNNLKPNRTFVTGPVDLLSWQQRPGCPSSVR